MGVADVGGRKTVYNKGTQAYPCMHDIEGRNCMVFGVGGIDQQDCLEVKLQKAPL